MREFYFILAIFLSVPVFIGIVKWREFSFYKGWDWAVQVIPGAMIGSGFILLVIYGGTLF